MVRCPVYQSCMPVLPPSRASWASERARHTQKSRTPVKERSVQGRLEGDSDLPFLVSPQPLGQDACIGAKCAGELYMSAPAPRVTHTFVATCIACVHPTQMHLILRWRRAVL